MNKDRNYICLHEAWFIFRGEVPRRCARDYLCPLLFYLPCWDIYMAPTTVPKYIWTYSYSYNTQAKRRYYMGYLRSEVWSRTDHYTDFTSTWSVDVYQPFLYKSTPSPIPKTFRLLKESSGNSRLGGFIGKEPMVVMNRCLAHSSFFWSTSNALAVNINKTS